MRIIFAIHLVFAIVFLMIGAWQLFIDGVSAYLWMAPGFILSVLSASIRRPSRSGAVAVVVFDALLIWPLTIGVARGLSGVPTGGDFVWEGALLIIVTGLAALLADWRTVRDAPWFF